MGQTSDPESPVIPGYTLDRRLGSGGGGEVYHGYREGSDRPLAIKVIRSGPVRTGSDDTPTRRAWRELDLTAQLRLPAVPRVIDYGFVGTHLFVASEFIDALPLDRYTEENRLNRRARAELLARVADAVHSVHEHGVIHRDLKPSNILVSEGGDPAIIDLGIAVLAEARRDVTMTADGTPIGTPAFMAPEQARGELTRISIRSDVYALGATAMVVLTGQGPHDLTGLPTHAAVAKVANRPARDPREVDPSLPRSLAAVLGKALQAEPSRRYPSAAEFGADLRRWLKGESVEARRARPWARATRWLGRHPVATTALACAALIAVSLATLTANVWWLNQRPDRFIFSEDGTRAWLQAVNGRKLRMIGGPPIVASIVRDPAREDQRLAAVCAVGPVSEGGTNYQLHVTPLDDLDRVLWSTTGRAPDLQHPPPTAELMWVLKRREGGSGIDRESIRPDWYEDNSYNVQRCLAADVFPEPDGQPPRPELVVLFQHQNSSPSPIRIYDLDGNVLFEAWHLGPVRWVSWMKSARLLVFSADRHGGEWKDRGHPELIKQPWPYVLFAIDSTKVQPGPEARYGWISDPTDTHAQSIVSWYKAVLPPVVTSQLCVQIHDPHRPDLRDRAVTVELYRWEDENGNGISERTERGGVTFHLDEHGDRIRAVPPSASDVYRRWYSRPGFGRPWGTDDQIEFGELPGLVGYEGAQGASTDAGLPSGLRP